ncbi:MAG: PilN domain-containing protein [Gammaproteobacteria bacterium]
MRQQVNLYQPELKPQRVVLPGRQMLVLGGLFLGALLTYAVINERTLAPLRAEAARLAEAETASEARVETTRKAYPPPLADKSLVARLEARRAVLARTREIATRLRRGDYGSPAGLSPYLEGFARQHVDGTWLTGVRVTRGGASLALEGKSVAPELVPQLLERLSAEPLFQGKAFTSLVLEAAADSFDEIDFAVRTAGVAARDDS